MKKPQCCKCGRALTDPFSIALGMGPECRGRLSKRGWRFPKPQYRIHQGRVELVGMLGKVEPPPVNTSETRKTKHESNEPDSHQRNAPAEKSHGSHPQTRHSQEHAQADQ